MMINTTDDFQMEYFEQSLHNGLYDKAEKLVLKREKLALKMKRTNPYAIWTKAWIAKLIIKEYGQPVAHRFELLIMNILEAKYGLGSKQTQ